MKRLLVIGTAAAMAAYVALADGEWGSRAPLQDTFVNYNDRNTAFGSNVGIILGNGHEGCMMFDVSGLANITAARLKLYITQCGTAEGLVCPVYVRVMRDCGWNENTLTWNSLPDEFLVAPSPILATNDVTLARYTEIPAGSVNSWCTIDITDAVKAAAPDGYLALHIYTYWENSDDNIPIAFASSDYTDDTLRPLLEFKGAAEAGSLSVIALSPTDDTYMQGGSSSTSSKGEEGTIVVRRTSDAGYCREGLMKFDLTALAGRQVASAELKLRTYTTQTVANKTIEFRRIDDTVWSETAATWSNPPSGVSPITAWEAETPENAVRVLSAEPNKFMTVELAPLVNQAVATGKTTLSLLLTAQGSDYFIFYSKECTTVEHRPVLNLYPVEAPTTLATRTPEQETLVSSYNDAGKDTAYYNNSSFRDRIQIGCSGNRVLYGLMLFDTDGLENADFVRFRVMSSNTVLPGEGALRISAWTTDRWNETNLTWNTAAPWFPQPTTVSAGYPPNGLVADIYTTQQKGNGTYFEVDVTAAARAAAAAGKMLTIGLFSNYSWHWFYKGASAYPAVLIYPDPDATFGNRVKATLDRSGETPALRLTWSPCTSAGVAYTVERQDKGAWTTVATGLLEATCLDASAKPYETHIYRITETTSGESVTKSVVFAPEIKVMACADTFVRSGGYNETSYGTDSSLVHKHDWGGDVGTIREGFYRFDLSEVPENFKTATLKFYTTGPDANYSGNEAFYVLKYSDFEWTDDNAPSWSDVFDNGWATWLARDSIQERQDSKRMAEELLNENGAVTNRLLGGDVLEYDVAAMIRAAKANGESHITLHTCVYDPDNQWNFGIISRERVMGGLTHSAQIVFTLRNWIKRGTQIVIR